MNQTFLALNWNEYEFRIRVPKKLNSIRSKMIPKKVYDDEGMGYYIKNGLKFNYPICCTLFFSMEYNNFLEHYLNYEYGFDDGKNLGYIPCPACLDLMLQDLEVLKN